MSQLCHDLPSERTRMKFKKKCLLYYLIYTLGIESCDEPGITRLVENCTAVGGSFPATMATCKCSGCKSDTSLNITCNNKIWRIPPSYELKSCDTCQRSNCYSHYSAGLDKNITCSLENAMTPRTLENGATKLCTCRRNCVPVTLTCNNTWTWDPRICQHDTFENQGWGGQDDNLQATSRNVGGNIILSFSCKTGSLNGTKDIGCVNGTLEMAAPTCGTSSVASGESPPEINTSSSVGTPDVAVIAVVANLIHTIISLSIVRQLE